MEPKQRFPEPGRNSNFGGRNTRGGNEGFSRDRKFGGGGKPGFGPRPDAGGKARGFGDRNPGFSDRFGQDRPAGDRFAGKGAANPFQARGDGFAKGGKGDFGGRPEFGARGDFSDRKPSPGGKPGFGKPSHGPRPFTPRGDAKRSGKPTR
jgi:hypothetical protein